jgi:hypothetical protein
MVAGVAGLVFAVVVLLTYIGTFTFTTVSCLMWDVNIPLFLGNVSHVQVYRSFLSTWLSKYGIRFVGDEHH